MIVAVVCSAVWIIKAAQLCVGLWSSWGRVMYAAGNVTKDRTGFRGENKTVHSLQRLL